MNKDGGSPAMSAADSDYRVPRYTQSSCRGNRSSNCHRLAHSESPPLSLVQDGVALIELWLSQERAIGSSLRLSLPYVSDCSNRH